MAEWTPLGLDAIKAFLETDLPDVALDVYRNAAIASINEVDAGNARPAADKDRVLVQLVQLDLASDGPISYSEGGVSASLGDVAKRRRDLLESVRSYTWAAIT